MKFIIDIDTEALERINGEIDTDELLSDIEEGLDNAGLESFSTVSVYTPPEPVWNDEDDWDE